MSRIVNYRFVEDTDKVFRVVLELSVRRYRRKCNSQYRLAVDFDSPFRNNIVAYSGDRDQAEAYLKSLGLPKLKLVKKEHIK